MRIINVFIIILVTLCVYSIVAITTWLITNNDEVFEIFGAGIIGLLLIFLFEKAIIPIYKFLKYFNKRSIFEEISTGDKYTCKLKYTNDIEWLRDYKIIKRYASKKEYKDIAEFNIELLKGSQKNCNHCIYDKECDCDYPYDKVKCKHDEYGQVLEFDKFKKGK